MRATLANEIQSRCWRDNMVFLTGDLGFMAFEELQTTMGDRFINTGVAEANMIGVASGLTRLGFLPVCYSIVPFLTLRCLEQIRVQLCQHRNKVILAGIGAGYAYGAQGPSHHATEDLAAMLALPGMTVVTPCSPLHIRATLDNMSEVETPVYLRLGMRESSDEEPSDSDVFRFGKIETRAVGSDAAIVVAGPLVGRCLRVARRLKEEGLDIGVHVLHCLKPLDVEGVLGAVRGVQAVFTIEQHGGHGGLASLIALALARHGAMPRIFHDFSFADEYMYHCGSMPELEGRAGFGEKELATTISRILGASR